jgi:hypothetical protein
MAEHSRRSLEAELQQCRVEIESVRNQLLDGHPDIHGLVLAWLDWVRSRLVQPCLAILRAGV